jgi:hypothetical protein
MIRNKEEKSGPIIIDLTGPEGNAFVLMGMAAKFASQLKLNKDKIIGEMMSGDYEHLLQVFDREFGEFVILER